MLSQISILWHIQQVAQKRVCPALFVSEILIRGGAASQPLTHCTLPSQMATTPVLWHAECSFDAVLGSNLLDNHYTLNLQDGHQVRYCSLKGQLWACQ